MIITVPVKCINTYVLIIANGMERDKKEKKKRKIKTFVPFFILLSAIKDIEYRESNWTERTG